MGLPEPSLSHPEKPSSSRQKEVFLRSDPIDKNGGLSLYTPYKTVSTPPPSPTDRRSFAPFTPLRAKRALAFLHRREEAKRAMGRGVDGFVGGGLSLRPERNMF